MAIALLIWMQLFQTFSERTSLVQMIVNLLMVHHTATFHLLHLSHYNTLIVFGYKIENSILADYFLQLIYKKVSHNTGSAGTPC